MSLHNRRTNRGRSSSAMRTARAAIKQAKARRKKMMSKSYKRSGRTNAFIARKRAANSLADHYSDISLGAAMDTEAKRLCIATYHPIEHQEVEGLGVFQEIFDLENMQLQPKTSLPFPSSRETVAHIDIHVLMRMAKRVGNPDLDAMLSFIQPALAWSLIAERERFTGNFFVPCEDGLFCCERSDYLGGANNSEKVVRIKTFLHRDDMNNFSKASHELLSQEGAIKHEYRFPTMRSVGEEDRRFLNIMGVVGSEWELRTAPTNLTEPEGHSF